MVTDFWTPQAGLPQTVASLSLGSEGKLLVGSSFLISFLRGKLINHDTRPPPAENQSNPIAPGWLTDAPRQNRRAIRQTAIVARRFARSIPVITCPAPTGAGAI